MRTSDYTSGPGYSLKKDRPKMLYLIESKLGTFPRMFVLQYVPNPADVYIDDDHRVFVVESQQGGINLRPELRPGIPDSSRLFHENQCVPPQNRHIFRDDTEAGEEYIRLMKEYRDMLSSTIVELEEAHRSDLSKREGGG